MKYTNIRVLIARSRKAIDERQCDDVRDFDTVKEARSFARHALTDAYRARHEFPELMNNSRVMATENGREVCLEDFMRKGYVEPVEAATEAEC